MNRIELERPVNALAEYLFGAAAFMPHGYCLLWQNDLLALHAGSDVLIAAAYFAIPATIYWFVRQREGLRFPVVFHLFTAFIFWCGLSHVVGLLTLWHPVYGLHGVVKAITAVISIATVMFLWRILPMALRLPSPASLEAANRELAAEVARRRKVEEELRTAHGELEARVAERTREAEAACQRAVAADQAKSQFLAQMSHDLRTPLNAVLGFSEAMKAEMFGPIGNPRYLEYAGLIHQSGAILLELIEDLLDLSRIEAGRMVLNFEPIELDSAVLESVAAARMEAARKGICLVAAPDDRGIRPAVVNADHKSLRRMIDNLLVNAVRYTPEGGCVEVRCMAGLDAVRVTVADSGPGIAPDDIPQMLKPFVRGKRTADTTEGTGLGLPIVKSMIELHGGRLEIGRSPLGGAAMTLVFPPLRPVAASVPAELATAAA